MTAIPRLALRSLQEEDLDALLDLYGQLHPEDPPFAPHDRGKAAQICAQILSDKKMHCLGGFLGNRLVCTCLLVVMPNLTRGGRPFGLIENVVTDAQHRKCGYGRAMIHYAQHLAWESGCYKLMLLTGRKDEATQRFYESSGFDRHTKQAFYCAAPA